MSTPPQTQRKTVVPMSEATRTATGTVQWLLERPEDAHAPTFNFNNLSVYVCGEEAFARIAEDIKAAEHSIDICCWGFDPAMELTRRAGDWPRGDTWGDLLRQAAEGKNVHAKKVQVRVLSWYDPIGSDIVHNMSGYRQVSPSDPWTVLPLPGPESMELTAPLSPTVISALRERFNRDWYASVEKGEIEGLALRTRGSIHAEVVASLEARAQATRSPLQGSPGRLEAFGMEYLATHHQKTLVIDYEGEHPRAYVMGLNSVTDYWDTAAHEFNDPRRGQHFEGDDSDHSVGPDWASASSGAPTLKPYQDFACRIVGEAVAAVCKNFDEAWNAARHHGPGGGRQLSRNLDLKRPPANLTQHLKPPFQRAQIVRTAPAPDGGERSIERLYHQASSFARHYLYIENQYFQNAEWAHALKEGRRQYVQGFAAATPPVPMSSIPVLHLMVVMPTPERPQMIPRTHDALSELGHGDSLPNQDRLLNHELERHAEYERQLAAYRAQRTEYELSTRFDAAAARYPLFNLPRPPPLSDLAKSHLDASDARDSRTVREQLAATLGMRTLFASLWSGDPTWSLAKSPVMQRVRDEQARYAQWRKEWEKYQADRQEAKARDIAAGGWGSSMDTRLPPQPPPDRTRAIQNATAQRYREIYIHSKLMLIDDSMFTLGSANLNLRSFAVDSEINIASDNAPTAKALRQRVWAQHTAGRFDGGDATDNEVMTKTFKEWGKEAKDNLDNRKSGKPLTSCLVAFLDERTATYRLG